MAIQELLRITCDRRGCPAELVIPGCVNEAPLDGRTLYGYGWGTNDSVMNPTHLCPTHK